MKSQEHVDPFTQMIPPKRYPIIQKENDRGGYDFMVFILDYIEAPHEFAEILTILDTAEAEDTIIFKLNTGGGRLDSTISVLDAIRATPAQTISECSGTVASAGTMFALACDGLYISKHCEFMIHNFSGGAGGKGGEIKSNVKFMMKHSDTFYKDIYKDFLTKKEMKKVIADQDFYFTADEVNERWLRVIEAREKAITKDIAKQQEQQEQEMVEHLSQQGYTVTKS